MKLAWLFMAVAFSSNGAIQVAPTNWCPELGSLPAAVSISTNRPDEHALGAWESNSNWPALDHSLTNRLAPGDEKLLPPEVNARPPVVTPPGVYQTAPYTCLIKTVGPQWDDKSVWHPGPNNTVRMPEVNPTLRLIPYPPAGNKSATNTFRLYLPPEPKP